MKVYFASDHAGFELKDVLVEYVKSLGYEAEDMGASAYNAEDDYPDFVKPCAEKVASDPESRGVVIGGSGQGEMICANKVAGVRAALFYGSVLPKREVDIDGRTSTDTHEIVHLARLHNNANILALSSRFLETEEAKKAVSVFLDTPFSGEERHMRRIAKL